MSTHPSAAHRDIEAEFIGAVMQTESQGVYDCADVLAGEVAFADITAQAAWDTVLALTYTGQTVTPTLIRSGMIERGVPAETATTYVVDRAAAPTYAPGDAQRLAERVRDGHVIRTVHAHSVALQQVCNDPRNGAAEAVGALTDAMQAVSSATVTTDDIMGRGEDLLVDAFEAIKARADGALPGITTGSTDLDAMTGGLAPGQVVVIGGRPAVGKSVAVIDLARAALRAGAGVMIFTMEMTRYEVAERMISAEATVDATRIRTGRLTADDEARFFAVMQGDHGLPWDNLVVIDKPSITIGQVSAIARQVHREFTQNGIEDVIAFVDYAQIMGADARAKRREQTRQQFLGEVFTEFKALAMGLKMPWVVLSQLNRGAGREKPPTMEDLRESGDIEQTADLIILLHRPDAADPEERPGEIDYLQVKHRQGVAPQVRTRVHQYRYYRTQDMTHATEGQ